MCREKGWMRGASSATGKVSGPSYISPLFIDPEVQRQVAGSGKDRNKDAQRSYIRPPECLCPEPKHGQDRGSGYIDLDTELDQIH